MRKEFKRFSIAYLLVIVTILTGCTVDEVTNENYDGQPTIILISIDGFRWDYPEKTATPNLDFLIKNGVRAKRLISCFPTKTFPNHYSIVTGLYPENHGIIANNMYDPELGRFSLGNRDAIRDPRWWGGEPIWVTAERQGLIAASYFWPGSETKIKGIQPTFWFPYDGQVPNENRIAQVLNWLALPIDKRPTFITTYFSIIDDAGHDGGPDSAEVVAAIREIDRLLGLLISGLEERNIRDKINVVVVSDHGMAEISTDRVIFLDDYIDLTAVDVVYWNPVSGINPAEGEEEAIYQKLTSAHTNMKVFRKDEVPEKFHYRNNPRIPKIIAIADEGWSIISHKTFSEKPHYAAGGNHGFDHELSSMGGLFVASGPAFRSGLMVEPFQNIHIYNLLAEILNLDPAPNDGNLDSLRSILK